MLWALIVSLFCRMIAECVSVESLIVTIFGGAHAGLIVVASGTQNGWLVAVANGAPSLSVCASGVVQPVAGSAFPPTLL